MLFLPECFTLSQINLGFHDPEKVAFLETLWEKEKILETSIFSFCHNFSCPIREKLHYLSHIESVVCKLFEAKALSSEKG